MACRFRRARVCLVRARWPHRALIDPCTNKSHLLRAQSLALRRHGRVFIHRCDAVHERAGDAVSGKNARALVAAFHGTSLGSERKPSLVLVRPMALEAGVPEYGLDISDKIHRHSRRFRQAGIVLQHLVDIQIRTTRVRNERKSKHRCEKRIHFRLTDWFEHDRRSRGGVAWSAPELTMGSKPPPSRVVRRPIAKQKRHASKTPARLGGRPPQVGDRAGGRRFWRRLPAWPRGRAGCA